MSRPKHGDLLEAVLAGISDTLTMGAHPAGPSPFNELLKAYQFQCGRDDRLPKVNNDSTGRELKDAIALLDPVMQVSLLNRYAHATKDLDSPTEYDPDVLKTQSKSLVTGVYWLVGFVLFFMLAVLVGVIIVTAVHMNVITEGEAIHNLLETAKDCVEAFINIETG
jgi:hypothetical protein